MMQCPLYLSPHNLRLLCPPRPSTPPVCRPTSLEHQTNRRHASFRDHQTGPNSSHDPQLRPAKRSRHHSTVSDPTVVNRLRRRQPVLNLGRHPDVSTHAPNALQQTRGFHDYFVTHLPSSSMHPDSRSAANPRHNLPRDSSSPEESQTRSPASFAGHSREMTVVRIPLKSAKHHFGAFSARGTRPYQEDMYQAGTLDLPSFAKKPPMSIGDRAGKARVEIDGVESSKGDPQIFYFGVFDGHGGDKCSIWLKDNLHRYLENSAEAFRLPSSLKGRPSAPQSGQNASSARQAPVKDPQTIQRGLIEAWRDTVGGYFRRFKPDFLPTASGGRGKSLVASTITKNNTLSETSSTSSPDPESPPSSSSPSSLESTLSYSFLRADLDFITASSSLQPSASKPPSSSSTNPPPQSNTEDSDPSSDDGELSLGRHTHHSAQPFLGGSTSSIALISTPTATPFWHPASAFSILTAHLGDTRILLSCTASGAPVALTPTHHPSSPGEATRLRRFAASFTTDSFGEERISGLANTRAFGDRQSKRVGVSAEPSLTLYHALPGEFAFLTLISDGVTGVLSDQEIVDVVKEAKTPEEGARAVTGLATEIGQGESGNADNATCVVVRMGGWERRSEGGVGSLGTREERGRRREAASDPRAGRR